MRGNGLAHLTWLRIDYRIRVPIPLGRMGRNYLGVARSKVTAGPFEVAANPGNIIVTRARLMPASARVEVLLPHMKIRFALLVSMLWGIAARPILAAPPTPLFEIFAQRFFID